MNENDNPVSDDLTSHDPRVFVAALRARADRVQARAETPQPGDTENGLWQLTQTAMRHHGYADALERFLDEGTLP